MTALAAILSLPVTGAALAQQSQATDETKEYGQQAGDSDPTKEYGQQSQDAQDSSQPGAAAETASGSQGMTGDDQSDTVVATVGDTDILGSEVMAFIGSLPPQAQAQGPEMLLPMAVDQLILRELILEEAKSQNLADDPEVRAMVQETEQRAEEDAIIQVWLMREMADAVSDSAVQQAYDKANVQGQTELPPIERLRPQIERHLRQQAMQEIQEELREGADVVLYDPSGQPIESPQAGGSRQSQSSGTGSDSTGTVTGDRSGAGSVSGNTATGSPLDGQSSESETGSLETLNEDWRPETETEQTQ